MAADGEQPAAAAVVPFEFDGTDVSAFERARIAIEEAHNYDDLRAIRDHAESLRAHKKRVGESVVMQNMLAEIRIRAERRLGEGLHDTPLSPGGRPRKTRPPTGQVSEAEPQSGCAPEADSSPIPTLRDLGITRNESARYQKLAATPIDRFDDILRTEQADGRELTTKGVLRRIRKDSAEGPPPGSSAEGPGVDESELVVFGLPSDHSLALLRGKADLPLADDCDVFILTPGSALENVLQALRRRDLRFVTAYAVIGPDRRDVVIETMLVVHAVRGDQHLADLRDEADDSDMSPADVLEAVGIFLRSRSPRQPVLVTRGTSPVTGFELWNPASLDRESVES